MAANRGGFLYADTDTLRGVTLALKNLDRDVKKEWAAAMRSSGSRVWASAVAKRKTLPQDKLFGRASVSWSMGGKGTAKVAVRPLSGGLAEWRWIDFGSKKNTGRLPRYNPTGRVVYGAVDPFGKWMGQMAVKTVADLIREATNSG